MDVRVSHTPGPWHLDRGMPTDDLAICDRKGIALAEVFEYNRGAMKSLPLEANARLIAAAPALLEALEEATAEYLSEWGEPQPGFDPPPAWFTHARAAITQAKGES